MAKAYYPAKLLSRDKRTCSVVGVYNKKEAVISVKELGPSIKKVSHLRNLTSDLVQLDEINEPTIINLLARRYKV